MADNSWRNSGVSSTGGMSLPISYQSAAKQIIYARQNSLPHSPGGSTRNYISSTGGLGFGGNFGRSSNQTEQFISRQSAYVAGENARTGQAVARTLAGKTYSSNGSANGIGLSIELGGGKFSQEAMIQAANTIFRLGDIFLISLTGDACVIDLDNLEYPPDYEPDTI